MGRGLLSSRKHFVLLICSPRFIAGGFRWQLWPVLNFKVFVTSSAVEVKCLATGRAETGWEAAAAGGASCV